jgi:ABC-type uncharacterized transport system involved in gliding motility auxiliary subunit
METALKFSGYFGLVLIGFGTLGAFFVQDVTDQPLLVAHLLLGVLSLLAWGVTSGWDGFTKAGSALSGRAARYSANAVLYTAITAGLVVVANILVSQNDKRWDLTEAGVYSLSEKSVKAVQTLKGSLKLIAIDAPQVQDKSKTEDLLRMYAYHNSKQVKWEILNPRAKPVDVDRLGMKAGNLLYLEYAEGEKKSVSRVNTIDEQTLTNAILKLTRGAAKKIYYVQGHGEPELDSQEEGGLKEFADILEDEHLKVEGLNIAQKGEIPSDAAAVILAAPKAALRDLEKAALTKYGENGGRVVLFAEPENRAVSDVAEIAGKFGITVGNDILIDQQLQLFAGPQLAVQFFAHQYGAHPITARLSQTAAPIFSFASSVTSGKGDAKSTYAELVKSGPASWAEKNTSLIFDSAEASASKDPDDLAGPVSIAVALERKLDPTEAEKSQEDAFSRQSRIVVFGDTTWILNGSLQTIGNRDLILNVMNWSVGEDGGVAIGPKSMRPSMMPMKDSEYNLILAFSFLGPEVILLMGLFVWWSRRRLVTT